MDRRPELDLPSGSAALRWYGGMALIAATVIVYEVAITRILSVVLWYHFAFLSISLAMLAIGAPGVWFAVRPPGPKLLRRSLLGAGLAVPLSLVAMFELGRWLPRLPDGVSAVDAGFTATVLFVAACALLPLLFLGTAVCALLIAARGRRIGWMYGADLLGAALGAVAVVPLLHLVPTPRLVAGLGLFPLVAAVLLDRRSRGAAGVVATVVIGIQLWGTPLKLSWSKEYSEGEGGWTVPVAEVWTPTARLTVLDDERLFGGNNAPAGWGLGSRYVPGPIEQMAIQQDGSAATPLLRYAGPDQDLSWLFYDVTSVGYQVRTAERVCIIGAGGGRDVHTALLAGATDVDAVELNEGIITLVSETFADYSGRPYHLPGVHGVAAEGRSFLTASRGGYDLIQISLIDSWAATAAGAYALSENFLYTVESFRLYWNRMSDDGLLSVSRWMGGPHRLESARLVLLAQEALGLEGVEAPKQHLAVVQGARVATLLVSKQPWTAADVARLDAVSAERGFTRHWPMHPRVPRDSLVAAVLTQGSEQLDQWGFTLDPPTDDMPFFFHTAQIFSKIDKQVLERLSANESAGVVLRGLLIGVSAVTLALFFLPFALGRWHARGPGFWRGSAYFACIGVAFMLVETAWLQRLILFLGHPSYATTVALTSLLLGAGAGSLLAAKAAPSRGVTLGFLLPAMVVAVNALLGPVSASAIGLDLPVRVCIAVALLFPAGVVMGLPFPWGMVRFGDRHKAWYWAMNGATSVLASVLSLALAMVFGFSWVAYAGAVFYAGAWALFAVARKA